MRFSSDDARGGASSQREPPAGEGHGPAPDEPTGGDNSAHSRCGDGSYGGASDGASAGSLDGLHEGDATLSKVTCTITVPLLHGFTCATGFSQSVCDFPCIYLGPVLLRWH